MDKEVMSRAFKRIVENDGKLLEFVPEEFKDDEEMLMYAIANNREAFKYVPEDKKVEILSKLPHKFRAEHVNWDGVLKEIPKESLSKEMCHELVEKEPRFFTGVPKEFIDEKMCLSIVQQKGFGWYIEFMPDEFKTQEVCDKAVEDVYTGKRAMENVPEDKRTPKLCDLCVKGNTERYGNYETDDLRWKAERLMDPMTIIPVNIQTSEMYEIIGEKYPYPEHFLNYVPQNLITQNLCTELIKRDGRVLDKVPEDMRTQELCLEAMRNRGKISEVPENLRNTEMYIEYLSSVAHSKTGKNVSRFKRFSVTERELKVQMFLDKMPAEIKNDEFWKKLVEKNGYYLIYAPSNIKNEELYAKAVKSFPDSIVNIPEENITEDMYIDAAKNGVELKYIKEEHRTSKVWLEIIKNEDYYYRLEDIPAEKMSFDIYVYMAQENKIKFDDIPKEISLDRKFWKEVIDKNANFLKYAPKDMITHELCQNAIEESRRNLGNIPEEFRTLDICEAAMQPRYLGNLLGYDSGNNPEIFKYIPKEYAMEFVPKMNIGGTEGLKLDDLLERVPEDKRTNMFYIELLRFENDGLKYIPEELLKNQEFWTKAVETKSYYFEIVPEEFRTPELYKKAVKSYSGNIKYVPDNMMNKEMYEILVHARARELSIRRRSNILEDIPEQYITPEIYAEGVWGGFKIDAKAEMDVMLKMYNFDKLQHFVPGVNVLKKYPLDQIEKFDKKIWWHLTNNELYNSNVDSKNALVEALLSFGAFDKDDKQKERVGTIEHFAKYLPKQIFKINLDRFPRPDDIITIENNFEIKKYNKYVINTERMLEDPDFLSLFESKDKADEELDYIVYDELDGAELSESQMKKKLEELSDETHINAVLNYVLKKGYEKQIDEKNVGILLKTDLQELKNKNHKEGYELEKKIRDIYYKADPSFMMTPTKLHRIFDGMDMKYKPEFYEFFKNNMTEILKNQMKQNEISKIQNQWDEIVQANLGQRITFDKCEKFLYEKRYKNVEFVEISKLSSNCGYSQEQFEEVQNIYREQLKRKESSIPQIEGKCKGSEYTYKVLRLDDPTAIFVGELTDCCQAIDNAGESCMRHSTTSPNGRVLIVQDKTGKVLSQSWLWRNKNVICFDNIEAVQKDSDNKKVVSTEILKAVKQAAKDFVEADKIGITKYEKEKIEEIEKEKDSISKQEYDEKIANLKKEIKGQQLNKVTVGVGYTDISLSGLKTDDENKYPEENVAYIADSRSQLILYEDTSIEHEDSGDDVKTITSLYSDNEKSKKVINIDTSEIEYVGTYEEDELDDEYEENIENEMIDIEDGYIDLGDIETVINHPQDRAKARQALENIKEYLKTMEGKEI